MRFNAIAAVLALNLALAGALAYLWSDEERTRWAEPAALPPSLEDMAAAPVSEPVDVSRYRETVERPLFVATRRPGPRKDPSAEAEAAIDALKDVRLLGTYGAGERGGIIVVNGGKVQRLAVGETIGGWKVASGGEGRSAELVRASGERRRLDLALNSVAPAVPGAPKGSGQDAAQPAAAEPAQASTTAAPAATSQRAAAARGGARGGGGWGRRQERTGERRAPRQQQPTQETR